MLPLGRTIHEEGIIFNNLKLVEGGVFMTDVINIQTPTGGGGLARVTNAAQKGVTSL